MSIAFQSDEVQLQNLRERLRKMSDEELVKFGKTVRGLSEPRVSVTPDPWKAQLLSINIFFAKHRIQSAGEFDDRENQTFRVRA